MTRKFSMQSSGDSQLAPDLYEKSLSNAVNCARAILDSSVNIHFPPVQLFNFRGTHDHAGRRNRHLVGCVEVCCESSALRSSLAA